MSYSIADERDYPRMTPAVQWLIAINIAIFFLQLTVVQPADVQNAFGFELRDLTEQPWTVLTYMFVHAGFWHLALNMYTLWLFGPRVEHAWSAGSFTRYYLWCGLGAWLVHVMLTRSGLLVGASGAIFGVMLAYAMRWPDEEIMLFPIPIALKVKWFIALLVAFNLLSAIGGAGATSGVAYLAHLGGFAFGWMWLRTSATSLDRLRRRMSQIPDVPDETPRAIPRTQPRARERGQEVDEIVQRSKAAVAKRNAPTPRPHAVSGKKTDELDYVLDKISAHGIDSLTTDERRLLEEMSKKLKGRE